MEDLRCCRACLSIAAPNESNEYIHLFEAYSSQSDSPTVLEVLNKYTQLQIGLNDFTVEEYPPCHFLCGRCLQDLRHVCEFIKRTQMNNKLLMGNYTIMGNIEFEPDPEASESSRLLKKYPHHKVIGSESGEYGEDPPAKELANELGYIIDDAIETNEQPSQSNCQTFISIQQVPSNEQGKDDVMQEIGQKNEANASLSNVHAARFEFKCEFCTSVFEFQRDLLQHYEMDHGDKTLNFLCDICENRFVTKNALRLHRRQVHQNDEYIDCDLCGRTVLKSFYNAHLKRHKQLKFLCSKCPTICASSTTLRKHMELHSDERDRKIECLDCGRRFYTMENLQMHQATHVSPEERAIFECTICSKTFLRKNNLGLHMQMHRGETIDCPHCGKKFVRRKDLEIHIRFHTGEYPYACSMCDRKFAIKGHLNYHEKRHLGVRYKCDECEKTFINLAGLRQHQYEHTGMPLLCGVCLRGFPTNFKVRRHLRAVHSHLFKKTGYTDALAKKFITPAAKSNEMLEKNAESSYECIDQIEMLDEDIEYVSVRMLTN